MIRICSSLALLAYLLAAALDPYPRVAFLLHGTHLLSQRGE